MRSRQDGSQHAASAAAVITVLLLAISACGDDGSAVVATTTTGVPEQRPRLPGAAPSIAVSAGRILSSDNSLPARFEYRDASSDERLDLERLPEELFSPSIGASPDGFTVVGTRCGRTHLESIETPCDPGGAMVLRLDRSGRWHVVVETVPGLEGQWHGRIEGVLDEQVVFSARQSERFRVFAVDPDGRDVSELPQPPLQSSPDAADTSFGLCAVGGELIVGRYEVADATTSGPSQARDPLSASTYDPAEQAWSEPVASDGQWSWDNVGFAKFFCTRAGLVVMSQGPRAAATTVFADSWRISPQAPKLTDWVTAIDEGATTAVWFDRTMMRLDVASFEWTTVRDEKGTVAAVALGGDDHLQLQYAGSGESEVQFVRTTASGG